MEHMLSISQCPTLTILRLTVDAPDPPQSLSWTANFISNIPSRSAIEILELNLRFDKGAVHRGEVDHGEEGLAISRALRDIGIFISKPTSLPRLQALEIGVQSDKASDARSLRSWVREALDISPERNLLHWI